MRSLKDRLKSRKFWMAIVAALVSAAKIYFPEIPEETITKIVVSLLVYVGVEGLVDARKADVVVVYNNKEENKEC